MSALRREDADPLYLQLERVLQRLIDDEGLEHGARIPSEHQLSRQYGVSRHVVRQALDRLVAKGVLVARHGMGYFVNTQRIRRALPLLSSFSAPLDDGSRPTTRILHMQEVPAPPDLGAELSADMLLRLDRVGLLADEPVALLRAHYPLAVGRLLSRTHVEQQGVYATLARAGMALSSSSAVLTVRFASREDALVLDLPEGSPLIQAACLTRDRSGRAVEASADLYRADRFEFSFEARE